MKKIFIVLTAFASMAFATIMAQTVPSYVPLNGLVGYWGFTGNADDYSVMGNNGSVNGAVLVPDRFGNANNAYQFGSGQRISVPDSNYLDGMTTGLSFSFWVKAQTSAYTNVLISKSTGCQTVGDDAYGIYILSNGRVMMQYVDATGNNINQYGSIVVADNNWHHIAIVWNKPQTAIYVDGAIDLTITVNSFSGPIGSSGATLDFGQGTIACPVIYAFNESLDDICIYNRVLTSSEVGILYTGCTGAPSAIIIAIGNTSFCAGDNVLLKCTASGLGLTYQWKKNNANINGATSQTYSAKTNGTYNCVVTNPCGSATSNGIAATANTNASLTLTATGSAAFCAGDSVTINTNVPAGYSLQWYRNNVSLNGATANSYVAKQPGTYKVVSKNNANGCSRISSSSVTTTVNCRMANPSLRAGLINDETVITNPINLYPNPNAASFTFEYAGLSEEENGTAVIQLYNSTGQKVYEFNVEINDGQVSKELNLDGRFKSGIYLLKMQINSKVYDSKVMIN